MGNKRLRQIVKVFTSVGLTNFKEKNTPLESQLAPAKLRVAFETLGPSFVKIGQVLSTRSDILPKVYIDELSNRKLFGLFSQRLRVTTPQVRPNR